MEFRSIRGHSLQLDPKLTWLMYVDELRCFLVGDEKLAFSLSADNAKSALPIMADPPLGACNLPISTALYGQLRKQSWHGFQFLDREQSLKTNDGDLLRVLVFGPDYAHPVIHPASGAIFGLKSGSIDLLDKDLKSIEKTKTRGRAALAFAAHPTDNLIAYGDNYGTFHVQCFEPTGFGKAGKIIAKDRKASRLEFVRDGSMLAIGGMGYLQTFSRAGAKFTPVYEHSIAVRDFVWLSDDRVLVNCGMHGITALSYSDAGFSKIGEVKPSGAVQQMAISADAKLLACSDQESGVVTVYGIA